MAERLVIRVDEKGALVVSRNVEKIGTSAKKAGGGVKLLRSALGGLAAIGIGAIFASAVRTMAAFSQEMSTVRAITKATGDEFDELSAKARELGATTRFSATQAAEGMTFLARAGFDTNQVLAAIGPTLQLAQAGALDLGEAADIASNVLTGFRIEAEEAARVIDVLALAANSANTNVTQLGEAMSFVAPIASALGVGLEETTAAVQSLSDAGIQASRAGTNLTMVMRLMEAPTRKQLGVLEKLGLSAEDVRVSSVGLTAALTALRESGASSTDMFEFFGRSASSASVLLEAATGKLQAFTKANKEAEGTATEIAEIMDENLNGALLAVRSAWEELQLAFGEQGPQSALTQGLRALADVLRFTAENISFLTDNVLALAIAFGAIKFAPFLKGLTSGVQVIGLFNKGLAATKVAMAALAINPITVGLVALAAAVVAVNFAFAEFNKLQDEIEAIEERSYKMRLKRVQAQVKEIRDRKAATAAVAAYIEQLELENKFLGLTEEAQVEQINLARALEVARRPLTEQEQTRITQLLEEKRAIEALNEQRKEEEELLKRILAPTIEYQHELELLNGLLERNALSAKQFAEEKTKLDEKFGKGKAAELTDEENRAAILEKNLQGLSREAHLLGLTTREREKQADIFRIIDQLKAADVEGLTGDEQAALAALIDENDALEDQARIYEEIKGPQLAYARAEAALIALREAGEISIEEQTAAMVELKKELKDAHADPNILGLPEAMKTTFDTATDSLLEFTRTGKFEIRSFVADVLQQFAKIAAAQAFKGLGQALFGFAGGGSFQVAGSGGTDSQAVAFAATPGERVSIQTPAQQRAHTAIGVPGTAVPTVAPPQVNVKIINVTDSSEIGDYLQSAEGEEAIVNVISRNSQTVKQVVA
ncbi:MAG: phage tail tape measure protein [bacterium]|nr:phage tail tape measure protein [bacterium]